MVHMQSIQRRLKPSVLGFQKAPKFEQHAPKAVKHLQKSLADERLQRISEAFCVDEERKGSARP